MAKAVAGIYRNGKVELLEPLEGAEGSHVIVTLVGPAEGIDLRGRGISGNQAADLRHRLDRFARIGIVPKWLSPMIQRHAEIDPVRSSYDQEFNAPIRLYSEHNS